MHDNIREHMEVIGADGVHVGTVDHVQGDRIKLTKKDSGGAGFGGGHQDHHHFIPMGLVASVEGDRVRLSANADVAVTMEEEEGGNAIDEDAEDDSGTGETGFNDREPNVGLLADDAAGAFAGSEADSNAEPGQMTGSAPQEKNVSVTDMIDESGRGTA
ncbi:MAG: hypothetical protein DCF31_17315 [Alphaproteobacteria bacterium]|nr:MAG: hypothetical protein DCF31_17315 [Alphaproteobacteria bacterium]